MNNCSKRLVDIVELAKAISTSDGLLLGQVLGGAATMRNNCGDDTRRSPKKDRVSDLAECVAQEWRYHPVQNFTRL
jgi:hypothetical protein